MTPGQSRPELRQRIQRFIDAHICEPTLDAGESAAALGISVRHLHRVFSLTGITLGDCIRSRRLEHCRNDLASPHWRDRTVTEIAFCWGFNDSAHFSHRFRREFGVSPRTFRAKSVFRTQNRAGEERASDDNYEELSELRCFRPN
ncbi:MAG: helix-turn-helix domain-containing protein [Terriglobales bacterium]